MRFVWITVLALVAASRTLAGPGGNEKTAVNVNSRYTVEKVQLEGEGSRKLSDKLREDLNKLVGRHFDQEALNGVIERIKNELRARIVEQRLTRGTQPELIQVTLEVREKRGEADADLNKLAYQSKEGWTASLDMSARLGPHRVGVAFQSDADTMIERFAGYGLHYELLPAGGERVRLRFDYESFHQQWNPATLRDLGQLPEVPGIYRARENFQPVVQVTPVKGLEVSAGVSVERLQTQFPAAHTESAAAAITTLRYRRAWGDSDDSKQEFGAGYSLRAATRMLASDFVYVRHAFDTRYAMERDGHSLVIRFKAGEIGGTAPLFERFSLGNARDLRGWSKFDVAPLGGNRMVFGSVQYGYGFFQVFYDAGSVWDAKTGATARQSAGAGIGSRDMMFFAVAFPLKNGRMEPIFMMSMNF